MNAFYSKFLRESARPSQPGRGPDAAWAAFGKHPGWDDHIEDIGLETDSLAQAKQLLYIQGIGGLIDSGAWEKLPQDQVLPQFHHLFLWQRSGRFLLGRFWSSADGKGRARYPMVACLHSMGPPLDWVLPKALPELERIQQACQATRSASLVQDTIHQAREAFLARIAPQPWRNGLSDRFQADGERFLARSEWGENHENLLRILHQFQHQVGLFQEAHRLGSQDKAILKPQQIRVPMAADDLAEALLLWSQFFLLLLPPDLPLLLVAPLDESWVDVTIGQPAADDFFCLRVTPQAMPLASSIPYHFEPELAVKAQSIMAALRHGEKPWRVPSPDSLPPVQRISCLLAEKARSFFQKVRGR